MPNVGIIISFSGVIVMFVVRGKIQNCGHTLQSLHVHFKWHFVQQLPHFRKRGNTLEKSLFSTFQIRKQLQVF